MRRTREWWARLTKQERRALLWLDSVARRAASTESQMSNADRIRWSELIAKGDGRSAK